MMPLAPEVLDLVAIGKLLDEACADACRLNGMERDEDQDLEILRLHWRAVGLSEALAVLTRRPALVLHLEAVARAAAPPCGCSEHPSRLRTLPAEAPSPEKPGAAVVVDAGSGNRLRENGAGGARPVGDGGARVDSEGSVWVDEVALWQRAAEMAEQHLP